MPELAWYSWLAIGIVVLLVLRMVYEIYTAPVMEEYDEYEKQLEESFKEYAKTKKLDDERSGF
jgi:Tfp pilus assembly protein PilO